MKQLLPILLVFFSCMAQAQSFYEADSIRQLQQLKKYSYVLIDSVEKFSSKDVLAGEADHLFRPYESIKQQKAFGHYWLRFSLHTKTPFYNWQLVLADTASLGYASGNDYADVYFVTGQNIIHKKTGVLVPGSQKIKERPAGFNAVEFSLPASADVQVYVRVHNLFPGNSALSYPVLQHPEVPVEKKVYSVLLPVLSAIALIFCLMSFFFFFFIREKAYLFFALYTLFLSQHYWIIHPDVPFIDFYFPENPQLVYAAWTLLTHGGFIFFCLFGRYFMNLPALSATTDKYYRIFISLWVVALVIEVVGLMTSLKMVIGNVLNYFIVIGVLGFFIRFAFFKSVLARLYIAGAVWLMLFTVMGFLWGGTMELPFNPWPIAQVGQMLIYAAALAYKVRLNEKAKAEATRIKDMDEIKSRFFANISHEFRTPLTLIQGPLQQIEENTKRNEEAATVPLRHIKTMRRNTDRLLELVNQLLDLSKLDSGKMKLQVIKGDVLQLLKALTASYDSMAERKGIHYHVHFPEGTTIAFFDKDKLEKIVSNLLGNAIKYTNEGGTVAVGVAIEDNRLRITVDDNGPGIGKKELDKIFDRFYQVEGTEDKGSGIGLALVKELVDLYRGQISVSSEPGKGSRFKVSLPIDKASFKENELMYGEWKSEEAFINRNIEPGEEKLMNKEINQSTLPLILAVEDNADLRNFIRETVHKHYQIIEAVNGKEGLERAIAEVPDIIISDVMMPVMDGFALAEKLKKDERTSHIPVILLTARAGQHHKLEGLESGADDYLTKPFDARELLVRIQNLINQRKLLRKKFAGEILLKPSEVAVNSADEVFLNKIMKAIEENMSEEEFGVEALAKEAAMSRSQLHRKLVALTGQSPSEILRNTRLLRAKELLQKRSASPSEVAFKVGFNSHAYFSKCFKEEFGVSPGEVG